MKSFPSNQIPVQQIQRVAAEVLASAILEIFPDAVLVSGNATDLDFYYDFQFKQPLSEENLFLVEERMRGIIKENKPVEMLEMMRQNAIGLFRHQNQPYKIDELELISDNIVQIWKMGDFYDVCKPPYGPSSDVAQAFKLHKVERKTIAIPFFKAGTKQYKKSQVIRIRGTAWSNKADLKDYLKKTEKGKRKDHKALGLDMGLYTFEDEVFPNEPCWLPKGMEIRESLLNFLKSQDKLLGFAQVLTPNLVKPSFLTKTNPHKSDENDCVPIIEIESDDYQFISEKTGVHALLFNKSRHQEKDLPVRYTENHSCFFEGSEAELNGLFQTRIYLTDQAHIFCTETQALEELISALRLIDQIVRISGLKFEYVLKNKKDKTHLSKGYKWLENALNAVGFQFIVDKENDNIYATHGKGVIHQGPRIEVVLIDEFRRRWLISSLGVDSATSSYLGLNYLNKDGQKEPPVIIFRSVFNSLERFIALLVERKTSEPKLSEQTELLPLWFN